KLLDKAFAELALRSVDVTMPSYTHLQRAQPISAAAEVGAWAKMLDGDAYRFISTMEQSWPSPLGSGAIAGSSLPLDRRTSQFALYCGDPEENPRDYFEGSLNSISATASRDHALDFVYACAMTAMHLSRWAEQWIIYSSAEFGFIRTADRYTTGSSMMPQKRNPDM